MSAELLPLLYPAMILKNVDQQKERNCPQHPGHLAIAMPSRKSGKSKNEATYRSYCKNYVDDDV